MKTNHRCTAISVVACLCLVGIPATLIAATIDQLRVNACLLNTDTVQGVPAVFRIYVQNTTDREIWVHTPRISDGQTESEYWIGTARDGLASSIAESRMVKLDPGASWAWTTPIPLGWGVKDAQIGSFMTEAKMCVFEGKELDRLIDYRAHLDDMSPARESLLLKGKSDALVVEAAKSRVVEEDLDPCVVFGYQPHTFVGEYTVRSSNESDPAFALSGGSQDDDVDSSNRGSTVQEPLVKVRSISDWEGIVRKRAVYGNVHDSRCERVEFGEDLSNGGLEWDEILLCAVGQKKHARAAILLVARTTPDCVTRALAEEALEVLGLE